jgi:hypothetical protein
MQLQVLMLVLLRVSMLALLLVLEQATVLELQHRVTQMRDSFLALRGGLL